MAPLTTSRLAWDLVERQHGVVTHAQLVALGFSAEAIKHRLRTGRLRQIWRGIYVVGRPSLTDEGWWMGAVLACGEGALLSHASAAALWRIGPPAVRPIHVSVPRSRDARHPGVVVHRRSRLDAEAWTKNGIPLTSPVLTDKLDLIDPETLRAALEERRGAGVGRLKKLLDTPTFVLTDSELERLFVPIALRAGLPKPEAQAMLHGHRVDFFFSEVGVVVETDGLRYHRTPTQQGRDRVRDQELTAADLCVLRFTHAQVKHEPEYVERILARTATARDRAAPRGRDARRPRRSRPGRAGSA